MPETTTNAVWFSSPNICLLELVAASGIGQIVIDLEHGVFDLATTDAFILTARALGLRVHAKTLAPEMSPIQQMLDLGAHSVIIPHVGGIDHAEHVCAFAKFPPLGSRSCAGGRTFGYAPATADHFDRQNKVTKCYPMIETADSLKDIDKILALDTVDGVFIGPTDLALSQGRGLYGFTDRDQQNIRQIARAAKRAGKVWIMPAWTKAERQLSQELDVDFMVTTHEHSILASGLRHTLT